MNASKEAGKNYDTGKIKFHGKEKRFVQYLFYSCFL